MEIPKKMNKLWIEHCRNYASCYNSNSEINFNNTKLLALMGLFETDWILYNHTNPKNNTFVYAYGYHKL